MQKKVIVKEKNLRINKKVSIGRRPEDVAQIG
jgi:hypothetical protein